MDTKAIARRVILRGKARSDPEWAYLMLRKQYVDMIADIKTRPDDYRQAIEHYAPTMPPENIEAARELFPGLLAWSERGFGVPEHEFVRLPQVTQVYRRFGEGSAIDPYLWCYYQHNDDALADLRTLAEFAEQWRRSQGFIK